MVDLSGDIRETIRSFRTVAIIVHSISIYHLFFLIFWKAVTRNSQKP